MLNDFSLSLSRKFLLLAFLGTLLFALPFAFYARQTLQDLRQVQHKEAGVGPALQVLRIVQLTQQHRGLFNAGLSTQRAAKQSEADAAYGQTSADFAAAPAGPVPGAWKAIASEWSAITREIAAGTLARRESFARHTALVDRALALVVLASESHGLAYESTPEAHHLVKLSLVELPQLTEVLGRARALGAACLGPAQPNCAGPTQVAALAQTARLLRSAALSSLAKVDSWNGGAHAKEGAAAMAALARVDEALAAIERDVLGTSAAAADPAAYFGALTAVIDAQFAVQARAGEALQQLFRARMTQQRVHLAQMLAGMLLAAALAIAAGVAIARSISRRIRVAVHLAERVADGDLTVQLQAEGGDEIAQLQRALAGMVERLRALLAEVTRGARQVSDSSSQIAQGNVDLSQRTEEQASTLEETASSMEELTATVSQNAENARAASELARAASEVAGKGAAVVGGVVATMGAISSSSARIQEITSVIDGIAFQTNILALNAAVEAARAGSHGRGFAVVASEVRVLAQRSAEAAREIKGLIAASSGDVRTGREQVAAAGDTIAELRRSVDDVAALVAEIAAASREQSTGIEQVNVAMVQMDQVVQQNAALVEEAAAATESMKEEAASLLRTVSRFRLEAQGPALLPVPDNRMRVADRRQLRDDRCQPPGQAGARLTSCGFPA